MNWNRSRLENPGAQETSGAVGGIAAEQFKIDDDVLGYNGDRETNSLENSKTCSFK